MKLESGNNKNAFWYAFQGIKKAIKSEKNLKLDVLAAIVVVILAVMLRISVIEWIVCLLLIGGVVSSELMNTAIEATVDLFTRENKELAAKAKDVAAGAVLVIALTSAIIGGIIFVPKILSLIV